MTKRTIGEMRLGWKRSADPEDLMYAPIMPIIVQARCAGASISIDSSVANIPFFGKVSSTSREQHQVQPITAVLVKAVQVIEQTGGKDKLRRIGHGRSPYA